MKKKKVFQSRALNTVTLLEKLTWLLPVAAAIGLVWNNKQAISDTLKQDHSGAIVLALIILVAFCSVFATIFPFALLKVIFHYTKKQIMKNNSFLTVTDFDYYRDKLTGLSPGEISLITDLKIEQEKDVAASILKYKQMGILTQENDKYVARNVEAADLKNSDRYLISGLVNQTFSSANDTKWKKLVEEEAAADGYITRGGAAEKQHCGGCLAAALTPIFIIIVIVVLLVHMNDDIDKFSQILDQAPEEATLLEQFQYLGQYPQYYPAIATVVAVAMFVIVLLCFPILVIGGIIATFLQIKWYRRTDLGNEMAECIYGMKNFIHDYSNLSEYDQEQVVLWDDYLIYAVVLEENQQIVNDIMKRRMKK